MLRISFKIIELAVIFLLNFEEIYMQRVLIEKMISAEPKKRPTCREILASPIYWPKAIILQFLQDVSDRIEKLDPTDVILKDLEVGASAIIKNNWKTHICSSLQEGFLHLILTTILIS